MKKSVNFPSSDVRQSKQKKTRKQLAVVKKPDRFTLSAGGRKAKAVKPDNRKYYFALALIVLVSFIAYLPVLHNGFVNWDDDAYIQADPLILSINLKHIFSSFLEGYQPLTTLVWAIQYHFFGLNPVAYHAVNLLFHLLNIILVFRTVFLLSDKREVALVASLLFGIHPILVESVAWASELKNFLYVFFFLASYIFYMQYIKEMQRRSYFYCLLLFQLSLFSKGMAASLPVLLLLTDYFKGRKITQSVLLEKVPFFALSLIFGVVSVLAQRSIGAISITDFTFPQRIVFASYGFISYILKLIVPLNLCPYYSYPIKSGESIPLQYYAYPLLFCSLAFSALYSLRFTKKILFGVGFFAITIFMVVQLFPVGPNIMADHYVYLSSIGIFYLAGEGFVFLWNKKSRVINLIRQRQTAGLLLASAIVFYTVKTHAQCGVWENSLSLWNDVISRDQTIPTAYNNRGVYLEEKRNYKEAISDFNKAIELKPDYGAVYINRGNILKNLGKYEEAIRDYNKAIELKPGNAEPYNNRGSVLNGLQKYEAALSDFNKAIAYKPDFAEAYNSRGIVYSELKRYDEAFGDYNKAIQLKPYFATAYYNRGIVLSEFKKYEESFNDFSQAIAIQPDFAEARRYRGILLTSAKRYTEAYNDFNKVIELQPNNAEAYYYRGVSAYSLNKKDYACEDFKQASALGYQEAVVAYSNLCH